MTPLPTTFLTICLRTELPGLAESPSDLRAAHPEALLCGQERLCLATVATRLPYSKNTVYHYFRLLSWMERGRGFTLPCASECGFASRETPSAAGP